MRTNIVDISLKMLDRAITEHYAKTGCEDPYIIMSSRTAIEICKILCEEINKKMEYKLHTYKGYKVAINETLVYGEIEIR